MKRTTVASVVRLEATAELKKEVELELAVADPQELVNLKGLCSDCKCHDGALSQAEIKGIYDSTRRND